MERWRKRNEELPAWDPGTVHRAGARQVKVGEASRQKRERHVTLDDSREIYGGEKNEMFPEYLHPYKAGSFHR